VVIPLVRGFNDAQGGRALARLAGVGDKKRGAQEAPEQAVVTGLSLS